MQYRHTTLTTLLSAGMLSLLAACGSSSSSNNTMDDNDNNEPRSYEITVRNVTTAQPLSPLAVILHADGYQGWAIGTSAGTGLEKLAEGGDNSDFLAQATNVLASLSGSGAIAPGSEASVAISIDHDEAAKLTVATMLVNTNDAFAGVTGHDLSQLDTGMSLTLWLPTYDAGTEANDELAAAIPGPAAGGEGFNTARDDVNYVSRHPGVVTADDGYPESALSFNHRFDVPTAQLTVTRLN